MDWRAIIQGIAGGVLGGTAAAFGVSKFLGKWWIEKQKAKYSTQLEELKNNFEKELKRVQADIDRSIFVTHAHFDTEFLAMKEVSQGLAEVKIVYRRLNPKEVGKELTETERSENIQRLETVNENFLERLEQWAAFLEPEIYDEFDHCHSGADQELNRLRTNSPHEKDKTINAEYFWDSYRQVCQKIRDRLRSLSVLPRA
jgi:hypothetical protein